MSEKAHPHGDEDRRSSQNLPGRLRALGQTPWPRWILVVALVALYSGWIGYQVVRNKLYDFNLYYIAADGFRRGVDVYALAEDYNHANRPQWIALAARHGVEFYAPPYRYPPLTAQLVLPLTLLPPRTAGTIWMALTAVAFIASAWILGKSSSLPHGDVLSYLLLFAFVPPLTTLHAGQVNGFLLLALCLAVSSLGRSNWVGTGTGLALGTLLKLIPLALVLYLPWRRLWKATLVAVTVTVVLLLTAPLTFGPGVLSAYARQFFTIGQPGTVFPGPANQSLNGFLGRLLIDHVDRGIISRIYAFSAALAVAGTVACCWPPGRGAIPMSTPSPWRLEFGLIVCALQLITPYTWYHQLVLLLIPLFTLVCEIIAGRAPRWWLVPIGLGYLATDLHGLLWHHISCPFLLSTPLYTTVMLWAMLARLIWQQKREKTARTHRRTDAVSARNTA